MLKFAIVGCGRIAKRYVDLFSTKAIEGAELVAVADIQIEKAKKYADIAKVKAYQDFNEMVIKENPDVICVLTPSGLHAEHVVELAKHKKHIVVEKPMALSLADADKMIQACEQQKINLFVVKQNRFNLPVVKLREALEAGRFGKLVMGTVRVRWCRDQSYYDQDSWRGTWAYDGGVFTNQASHHIDLLSWMMGDVESVHAHSGTFLVKTETEDTGVAILKFKNGALGVVEATTAIRPKDLEGSLSVLGEKGSVEIGGFAVNKIQHWNFQLPTAEDQNVIQNFSVNPPNVYGFGHKEYLQTVVDSLNGKQTIPVSGREGRKSLEVINAFYESIETGKTVHLPFDPKFSKLGKKQ